MNRSPSRRHESWPERLGPRTLRRGERHGHRQHRKKPPAPPPPARRVPGASIARRPPSVGAFEVGRPAEPNRAVGLPRDGTRAASRGGDRRKRLRRHKGGRGDGAPRALPAAELDAGRSGAARSAWRATHAGRLLRTATGSVPQLLATIDVRATRRSPFARDGAAAAAALACSRSERASGGPPPPTAIDVDERPRPGVGPGCSSPGVRPGRWSSCRPGGRGHELPGGRRSPRPRRGPEDPRRRRDGLAAGLRDGARHRPAAAPPLHEAEYEGFVDKARMAERTRRSRRTRSRGVIVACPWLPDVKPAPTGDIRPSAATCSTCCCRACDAIPPRSRPPKRQGSTASRSAGSSPCASVWPRRRPSARSGASRRPWARGRTRSGRPWPWRRARGGPA